MTKPAPTEAPQRDEREERGPVPAEAVAPPARPSPRLKRPHVAVLAVGAIAIVAHQLLPSTWQQLSYDGIEVLVFAAMAAMIAMYRPRPSLHWWLLASGVGLLVGGDVIYNVLASGDAEVFPSIADAFYVASYVVMALAVVGILRRRARDVTVVVDTLLVTVPFAAAIWAYVIAPTDYSHQSVLAIVVSVCYPVMDVVLLALLARLLLGSGGRSASERFLATALALLLAADTIYARLAITDSYSLGGPLDALYHASYLFFAVAAAHPSMRSVSDRTRARAGLTRSRIWVLTATSLVLPLLAAVEAARDHVDRAVVMVAASIVASCLLAVRTGLLNSALRRAAAENQRLMGREVLALEEERRRIASDIHDDSVQAVTALTLRLQRLRRHLSGTPQESMLHDAEMAASAAIERLRHLIFDLHSPTLDREGLAAAVRVHLGAMFDQGAVSWDVDDRLDAEPEAAVQALAFRLAREATTNVAKHAQPSRVTVRFSNRDDGLHAEVADDGAGFSIGNGLREEPGHLGLAGSDALARAAGGWWQVRSEVGGGTTVEFWLPQGHG